MNFNNLQLVISDVMLLKYRVCTGKVDNRHMAGPDCRQMLFKYFSGEEAGRIFTLTDLIYGNYR